MIEKLGRLSTGAPCVKVLRIDFDIWDEVLARRPGMRLETICRAADRADAELMFARTAARADSAPGHQCSACTSITASQSKSR